MAGKEPTVKPVDPSPVVKVAPVKEMVTIVIDREMTDGGIMVNGKRIVGTVKVTPEEAKDYLRIQEEYAETKKKLMDKNATVRMKNDFQKEALFLAHEPEHQMKKGWSRDYGLLPQKEWLLCSDELKARLLETRKQMFGY